MVVSMNEDWDENLIEMEDKAPFQSLKWWLNAWYLIRNCCDPGHEPKYFASKDDSLVLLVGINIIFVADSNNSNSMTQSNAN